MDQIPHQRNSYLNKVILCRAHSNQALLRRVFQIYLELYACLDSGGQLNFLEGLVADIERHCSSLRAALMKKSNTVAPGIQESSGSEESAENSGLRLGERSGRAVIQFNFGIMQLLVNGGLIPAGSGGPLWCILQPLCLVQGEFLSRGSGEQYGVVLDTTILISL